jgi:hypothetical protein
MLKILRNLEFKMCKKCETNPVYEFTNKRKLCDRCYLQWFRKRFLYTFRKFEVNSRDTYFYIKPRNELNTIVIKDLFEYFKEKLKYSFTQKKSYVKILPNTLDDTSFNLINEIFLGEIKNWKKEKAFEKDFFKPLYLFLEKEVLIYARIRKLKYKKEEKVKSNIFHLIQNLEKNHPEIKHSIVNSFLSIN